MDIWTKKASIQMLDAATTRKAVLDLVSKYSGRLGDTEDRREVWEYAMLRFNRLPDDGTQLSAPSVAYGNHGTPSPGEKLAIMRSLGGILSFQSDPPFYAGNEHAKALGFWMCDAEGTVTRVSGQVWSDKYLKPKFGISQTAWRDRMPHVGGRIVIGLSGVKDDGADLARIEAEVPVLMTTVMKPLLVGLGWTIGRFGYGRFAYTNKETGEVKTFDERSTIVHIAGIDSEKLEQVALLLSENLNQNCVMVYDDNAHTVSMMGTDKPGKPPHVSPNIGPEFE